MSVKPISPDEVHQAIPDLVIQAFNELIKEKYSDRSKKALIYNTDVVDRIAKLMDVKIGYIYQNNLLDVERIFVEAGWKVTHNSPDRDENFKAHFIFSK